MLKEIYGEHVTYFRENDVSDLREKIVAALDDETYGRVQTGYQYVKGNYTRARVAEVTVAASQGSSK